VVQRVTQSDQRAALSKEEAQTYALVCHAIAKREQVLGFHRGQWVTVCPHTLGWRDGEGYLWCYELFAAPGGESAPAPLGSPNLWRFFRLADFCAVTTRVGFWLAPPTSRRPALDIDIELEPGSRTAAPVPEGAAPAKPPVRARLRIVKG